MQRRDFEFLEDVLVVLENIAVLKEVPRKKTVHFEA
jgi:hypothetical protein